MSQKIAPVLYNLLGRANRRTEMALCFLFLVHPRLPKLLCLNIYDTYLTPRPFPMPQSKPIKIHGLVLEKECLRLKGAIT